MKEKEIEMVMYDILIQSIPSDDNLYDLNILEQIIKKDLNKYNEIQYNMIFKYLVEASEKKPTYYEILQEMRFGLLYYVILNSESIYNSSEKLNTLKKSNIKNVKVFLDTNFVFSVFELHCTQVSKPVLELFNLLKQEQVETYIYSFTLEEIKSLLLNYKKKYSQYSLSFPVDHIYWNLKNILNWRSSDVDEFISNIDRKLRTYDIKVEKVKDISLDNYLSDEIERNLLNQYKPKQSIRSQNHDLAAIDQIKSIRKQNIFHKIDEAKAIFLTSDIGLSKYNYVGRNHSKNKTIK